MNIPDALDRLVLTCRSVADANTPGLLPSDPDLCPLCLEDFSKHDPDCAWVLARQLAPSDLDAVSRLARALRYENRHTS